MPMMVEPGGALALKAVIHWLAEFQWPLCAILFLLCVLVWLRTARSVRREKQQKRRAVGAPLADSDELRRKPVQSR